MTLAATGFAAMAQWDERALDGVGSTFALVAAGLGFGVAIAPVNAALLAATRPAVHGIASSLVVVARTIGMLVGLALLTAIGLRVFYSRQADIGSPLTLCPDSPADCPAYEVATQAALLDELQAIFAGAGVCAVVAAVLALALLTARIEVLDHDVGGVKRGR
jgi:ABC-type amino acid transport system permease subunit